MTVDSYLELFTTLFGWTFYGILWNVLVGTGIVFLPFLGILIDNWREPAEGGEFDEFDLNVFFSAKKNDGGKYDVQYLTGNLFPSVQIIYGPLHTSPFLLLLDRLHNLHIHSCCHCGIAYCQ